MAYLMENMGVSYKDCYEMPYGRRQRLVTWKSKRIEEENEKRKQSLSRMNKRR
jgi:hypothetical protein